MSGYPAESHLYPLEVAMSHIIQSTFAKCFELALPMLLFTNNYQMGMQSAEEPLNHECFLGPCAADGCKVKESF